MRFALSAEQRQFGASLHDLLLAADVPAAARAWAAGDPEPGLAIWRDLAKAGVTGLSVPERFGGLGADLVDLVVACEELGHHPVPGPLAESLAAVPVLLAGLAPSEAEPAGEWPAGEWPGGEWPAGEWLAGEWLAALAAGELIATLARPPRLPYALDADIADLVLLAHGGTVCRALPAARLVSADPARRLFEVRPAHASAEAAALIDRAMKVGTLASSALLLGAGQALLEASTQYARTRAQFGRPIGAFQAVKHQLADVAIGLEFARPLVFAAAIALARAGGAGNPTADRDVSAARVASAEAARRAARVALQVHGAIGYTRECDVSLWLAKIRALSAAWGSQAEHRAIVLAALAAPGAGPWS